MSKPNHLKAKSLISITFIILSLVTAPAQNPLTFVAFGDMGSGEPRNDAPVALLPGLI